MKPLFILFALIVALSSSAQMPSFCGVKKGGCQGAPHGNATGTHDSLFMYNLGVADTDIYIYSFSGAQGPVSGPNAYGYYGFAERYNYCAADSSIAVLGVAAVFVGKVKPSSAGMIQIKVWTPVHRPPAPGSHRLYTGLPSLSPTNSMSVPFTGLGISEAGPALKEFYFTVALGIADTFFVGYTTNYMWDSLNGDTIAIATTKDGNRTSPLYSVTGADTIVNVQNATLSPLDVWLDNGYELNFKANYWLFPIVRSTMIGHEGITRNDFTFYGNYPNPAIASTTIKFGLAHAADVKLQVQDPQGRTIKTIDKPALSSGEHLIQLSTSDMPSGNYLYVIRTSDGDGIAGRISVIR